MKRQLFESLKVTPYTSAAAIDREGFDSAVLGAAVTAAGTLAVAVTECDTSTGTFTAVADDRVTVNTPFAAKTVAIGDTPAWNLDLIGCKRYIKITITAASSAAATYALALGDPREPPVV